MTRADRRPGELSGDFFAPPDRSRVATLLYLYDEHRTTLVVFKWSPSRHLWESEHGVTFRPGERELPHWRACHGDRLGLPYDVTCLEPCRQGGWVPTWTAETYRLSTGRELTLNKSSSR